MLNLRLNLRKVCYLLAILCFVFLAITINVFSKVEWICASKLSETSMQGQYYRVLADAVSELTNGEFEIKIYSSETLGGTQAILDQLQSGAINLYPEGVNYLERFNHDFAIFSYPWIFKDTEHYYNFYNSEMVDSWREKLLEYKIDVLGLQMLDRYRVLVTTKPIFNFEDFQGLKLRMFPTQDVVRIWEYLGADCIITEWNDVYEGLRTGLIAGVTGPISGSFDMSFPEVAKYILRTDEFPQAVAWMMYAPDYEKLSPEFKEAFDKAMVVGNEWCELNFGRAAEERIQRGLDELNIHFSRINMKKWRDKVWELYPKFEEEGLIAEGALEYIDSIKK